MKIVALAGGTGSAKLLRGLGEEAGEFSVIANVGDNAWIHGLYVCPDVDIALYTLAGIADEERGWGIRGDTFSMLGQLEKLGGEVWFRLGDRDLAVHLLRTEMMKRGKTLTETTRHFAGRLGLKQRILPATDDPLETHIVTDGGEAMHLQEFWVRRRGEPAVREVRYSGCEKASPTEEVREAIAEADKIIFCPANPVTSVMPILSIIGMKELVSSSRAVKVALSPMIGDAPVSGPAAKLMRGLGRGTDSLAVAELYAGVVDRIVIDRSDAPLAPRIGERTGMRCLLAPSTLMKTRDDERRLARLLVEV